MTASGPLAHIGRVRRGEREPLSPSVMRPLLTGLVLLTAEMINAEPAAETGRNKFQPAQTENLQEDWSVSAF